MSQTVKTRLGRTIIIPTSKEDAAITKAAMSDPDALPFTDEEWEMVQPSLRQKKSLSENHKVFTTLRLDSDILNAFKNSGKGWQIRINSALKDWLNTH